MIIENDIFSFFILCLLIQNNFLQQVQVRSINLNDIEDTLSNPENITIEDDLTVYQKVIIENSKTYLLRIFVNEIKQPPLVVTAYKTSKIDKYHSL